MATDEKIELIETKNEDSNEKKVVGERRRMHDVSSSVPLWKDGDPVTWGPCELVLLFFGWLLVLIIPVLWFFVVKTVNSYERAIIFRLGKITGGPKGPGVFFINPLLDEIQVLDLRIVTHDLPPQDMMTRDSVTVVVDALCYLRVTNPIRAVLEVDNYKKAFSNFAATTLRSVIGGSYLQDLLSNREQINRRLQNIIETETSNWGVAVNSVEIQNVKLPESMQRSMAAEAEAERVRRAKVINARGESEAAFELANAARTISESPGALQLRYLHTLTEISSEKSSTMVFPLPLELVRGLQALGEQRANLSG